MTHMITSDFKWAAEVGAAEDAECLYFRSAEELKSFLVELERREAGKLHIFKDYGKRPLRWWQRLFRIADWHRLPCLTLFWCDRYATLMFHDEASSDYHALEPQPAADVPTEIRLQLNYEEPTPAPPEECLQKSCAFAAACEFIDTGRRPKWLSYRYVH